MSTHTTTDPAQHLPDEPAYPDCYEVPRTGGATRSGYSYEQVIDAVQRALAAQQPRTLPRDAAQAREFIGSDFCSLTYGDPQTTLPHESDIYEVTAHDLLSAFEKWAESWIDVTPPAEQPHTPPQG